LKKRGEQNSKYSAGIVAAQGEGFLSRGRCISKEKRRKRKRIVEETRQQGKQEESITSGGRRPRGRHGKVSTVVEESRN